MIYVYYIPKLNEIITSTKNLHRHLYRCPITNNLMLFVRIGVL